jgi:hypothetical protein
MNPLKQALMQRLKVLGLDESHVGYDAPLPLVALEEFFEGNSDPDSIAVNPGSEHPGVAYFHRVLREIRSRSMFRTYWSKS